MFFFLSKTVGYLSQPLTIVTLLLIVGLMSRRPRIRKILLLTSLGSLLIFSNHFLAHVFMRGWEVRPVPFAEMKGTYDYGILLTGITKSKAGPSDRVYFNRGADRATHTLQLYKLGLVRKVIISGGSGRLIDIGVREADELASFMILSGVKQEDLIVENKSNNTHDSAIEVANLLKELPEPKRLLLITSGYHLPRASACFEKAKLTIDVFATDPLTLDGPLTLDMFIVPKVEAFGIWQALFKEWAGMVAYKAAGYI
jgi:uncharacterized SAM-binding protein YcdF (DUF218 family)